MEGELTGLQHDLTSIKDTYATNTLTLSITLKYVANLLANRRVLQYLTKHHPDLLRELQETAQESAA